MIRRLHYIATLLLMVIACNDPDEAWVQSKQAEYTGSGEYSGGFFVSNEGNFGWGYGSISYVNTETGVVENELFRQKNKKILGNVVQSMTRFDDKIFIVVNNSQKIEVVNADDFSSVGRIDGLTSPRYFLPISTEKAYVSDLYSGKIWIVNPVTFKIEGEIESGGWTERLIQVENKVFVCHTGGNELIVIEIEKDQIQKRMALQAPPYHILRDKNNVLWVLCGSGTDKRNRLYKIDPVEQKIIKEFQLPATFEGAHGLDISPEGDKLYVLGTHVFTMAVDAKEFPEASFINAHKNNLFYSLGVDPAQGDIFVGDALDYLQNGWVFQYTSAGVKVDSFRVGVIPGHILFNP